MTTANSNTLEDTSTPAVSISSPSPVNTTATSLPHHTPRTVEDSSVMEQQTVSIPLWNTSESGVLFSEQKQWKWNEKKLWNSLQEIMAFARESFFKHEMCVIWSIYILACITRDTVSFSCPGTSGAP